MPLAARSTSTVLFRACAALATLGCAAVVMAAAALLVAPASETADPAVVVPDEPEEPDSAELDEEQLEDLVADAQRLLNLSGYDPGPIDGQLGPQTQRAIRAYQAAARQRGTLEALKGPAPGDVATRPELLGTEQPAPGLTQ